MPSHAITYFTEHVPSATSSVLIWTATLVAIFLVIVFLIARHRNQTLPLRKLLRIVFTGFLVIGCPVYMAHARAQHILLREAQTKDATLTRIAGLGFFFLQRGSDGSASVWVPRYGVLNRVFDPSNCDCVTLSADEAAAVVALLKQIYGEGAALPISV
jgi:hypothetical protein